MSTCRIARGLCTPAPSSLVGGAPGLFGAVTAAVLVVAALLLLVLLLALGRGRGLGGGLARLLGLARGGHAAEDVRQADVEADVPIDRAARDGVDIVVGRGRVHVEEVVTQVDVEARLERRGDV